MGAVHQVDHGKRGRVHNTQVQAIHIVLILNQPQLPLKVLECLFSLFALVSRFSALPLPQNTNLLSLYITWRVLSTHVIDMSSLRKRCTI